jgi:hypothetical protein
MPYDIDLSDEFAQLDRFYADAEAWLDAPDDVLFAVRDDVSGWSPAQHLHHIGVANGMSLTAALYAAMGRGETGGAPDEGGRAVLEREQIPRNRLQAPKQVSPSEEIDRAAAREAISRSRGKLDELRDQQEALATAEGRIEHPRMGMLNGPEWLRFVRIHSQHHHAIIEDILAAVE